MDPDSRASSLVRLAPMGLAALIILAAGILVAFGRLDGKDFIALVGQAGTIAGVARMMAFPSATTTTKSTDRSGAVTETKTQQPLGMSPPAAAAPAPEPPKATP